jgi:hypothetical protein
LETSLTSNILTAPPTLRLFKTPTFDLDGSFLAQVPGRFEDFERALVKGESGNLDRDPRNNAGDVAFFGSDGAQIMLKGVTYVNIKDGSGQNSTEIDLDDELDQQINNQMVVTDDRSGNGIVIDSNISVVIDPNVSERDRDVTSVSLSLGHGSDTLVHVGANSTFTVNPNFSGDKFFFDTMGQGQQSRLSLQTTSANGSTTSPPLLLLSVPGFIQSGAGAVVGSPDDTSVVVAGGDGQTANAGLPGTSTNAVLIAVGNGDRLFGDNASGNPTLGKTEIALGNNDMLITAGGNNDNSGINRLIAIGKGASAELDPGAGKNILISDGDNSVITIDSNQNPGSTNVIFDQGGTNTINFMGPNNSVIEVTDPNLANNPNALQIVANFDVKKFLGPPDSTPGSSSSSPPGATTIIINPNPNDKLTLDGRQVTGGTYAVDQADIQFFGLQGVADIHSYVSTNGLNYSPIGFNAPGPANFIVSTGFAGFINDGVITQYGQPVPFPHGFGKTGDVLSVNGFANGDLGVKFSGDGPFSTKGFLAGSFSPATDVVDQAFLTAKTHNTIDLMQFQLPPPPPDPQVDDASSVSGSNVTDTLLSIHTASASGSEDTLLVADGNDTLFSTGTGNTIAPKPATTG